ncbi:MAG: UDP-N-acetylglucosamine pyrophosphorylase [Kiritimatiellae bacterium]|nr:UDP-N-acetylglucosamine pyrophosphorylase [Kiritimatiellia bacterium]MDW8458375.1 UDP-N-acetylglucosamine pyrophosphorylase [Verrucomicrobiota bacterium]
MNISNLPQRVCDLLARGVHMPNPASVHVDDSIVPQRIAPDVVIHPGCRLSGGRTSIGPGCKIGAEAPVTLEDSQLGAGVEIRGGYISGAVFLDGASLGSGAHVRPGTLLEEQASGAHAVGLKQTILMPYVTLGSLINFCDVLMAGGTSRKNHGEVGSSFVHFNFTPHQDKATPSLIGDVPRGVFLDQKPIFLGGQGGLVGPSRIGYGCVTPAGTVFRGDAPGEDLLLISPAPPAGARPYQTGVYRGSGRILKNNLIYLGNIRALLAWYRHVRVRFMSGFYTRFCWEGAVAQLASVEQERFKRLEEWVGKLRASAEALRERGDTAEAEVQESIVNRWPRIRERLLTSFDDSRLREAFLQAADGALGTASYIDWAPNLPDTAKAAGRAWLQAIVDATASAAAEP